jgi:hypothetical protein
MPGIITPYNRITIHIDNRSNPAKVDMNVQNQMSIPELIVILHSLTGQLLQQLMMGPQVGLPLAPPAGLPFVPPAEPPAGEPPKTS